MANPFVHVELNTPDPDTARRFYSQLFDWKFETIPNTSVPDAIYTMIKVGDGTGGGILKQIPGGPSGWIAYVSVDDISAVTQKSQALGGKIMKDVTEVEGLGWLSFIQDPTGAILALWKSKPT